MRRYAKRELGPSGRVVIKKRSVISVGNGCGRDAVATHDGRDSPYCAVGIRL